MTKRPDTPDGPRVIHIAAVNLIRREVVTDEGDIYPITSLYDGNFAEVDDPSEAKMAVFGAGQTWSTFAVSDFETVPTQ